MNLEKVLNFAQTIIKSCTSSGDITIDATVGNGLDTLFLARLVNCNGHVYGFDIQDKAISNTYQLLKTYKLNNVSLHKISHDKVKTIIPEVHYGKITSAMFNLGYLPHGDKRITTNKETTIKAIKEVLSILKKNGIITIIIYPGHKEGKLEHDALLEYTEKLNQKQYQVLIYRFINQINNPPFMIAIEKL